MSDEKIKGLLRKGIAEMKKGTSGLSMEEVMRKYGLSEIVKLASNENSLGPSPRVKDALKKVSMNIYPDPSGSELRSAISETHRVKVEQVLQGNGAIELITFIGQTFLNENDECIIPKPTYHRYEEVSDIMGGQNIFVPLKEYRIDLSSMLEKVTSNTKLIIVVNPNNPTGDILSHNEVSDFLNKVGKDKLVIFDEAYGEYVDDKTFPNMFKFIEEGYSVIVLRTFSKAYGLAGVRLGYAISTPEIISYMNIVRANFNISRFAQVLGIEAMRDRDHFKKSLQMVREEKQYYYEVFNNLGLFYIPSHSNFIFVNVKMDDIKLYENMIKKGVVVRPMTPWGYKGFLRVTIGTHYQNEKMVDSLLESLKELKNG